jgi:PKD repeat protein
MKRFLFTIFFCSSFFIAERVAAQIAYAIQHSSSCAGSAVSFNSTVFETAQFPSAILWNFGDPASGLLNTAKDIQQPSHIYTTPGTYIVSLHVVDGGAGTIDLTDTITFVLPVTYNFGPDVFLCGDTGTYILNAPVVPNALYEWNDDTATIGPILAVKKSGTYRKNKWL